MNNHIARYLDNGFAVIPLKSRSKRPAIRWKDYIDRQPTIDEINEWFVETDSWNVGIITGETSGLVVVDVDGDQGFSSIEEAGGLPKTPTVRTGRGKHYYFQRPAFAVSNRTGIIPGVDIRADGGYVVAPPSVHESGQPYEWEVGLEAPVAVLPNWLIQLLKRCPAPNFEASLKRPLSRRTKREIDRILGELTQAPLGTRNDQLNKAAFNCGRLVASNQVSRERAQQQLTAVANSIGLTPAEVQATIDSGLSAGMQKPSEQDTETYEILDFIPALIDRPLKLIQGRGYGVTWLPLAPIGDASQATVKPVVFRDDGRFYSELDIPGSEPLTELGLPLDLPIEVSSSKRLSPTGFKRFIAGDAPNVSDVFDRLVKSIDAFVSFEQSTSEQRTMCELVACWTFGTYLTEAFDVVGYLWPNGERGSGKTQLVNTVTSLAYLGKTVTAGSSFASIRDEAHYGATIGFDDCENVKEMDANKRELLLAGNTRGTVITLKELVGDTWKSRSINSFAPRLFSAISLPDPVLDSRTVRVPMIASSNKEKTRRSPYRRQDWPCDLPTLIDDLWMLGVVCLPRLVECDAEAADLSPLIGRSHDIFRMPLAVAYWLEMDHEAIGLFDRISSIADVHQGQKLESGGHDLVSLALVAIDALVGIEPVVEIPTRVVVEQLRAICQREEVEDAAAFTSNAQRVGRMLASIGFTKGRSHGNARNWIFSRKELDRFAKARGIVFSARLGEKHLADTRSFELPV